MSTNMDKNDNHCSGLGIWGVAMIWGLITQALTWAGVIEWPWYAIWGPAIIAAVYVVIIFLVVVLITAIGAAIDR